MTLPMLGGRRVAISGICLNPDVDNVLCKFNDQEPAAQGYIVSIRLAYCVSPMIIHNGQTKLAVSLDGGTRYDFDTSIFIGNGYYIQIILLIRGAKIKMCIYSLATNFSLFMSFLVIYSGCDTKYGSEYD